MKELLQMALDALADCTDEPVRPRAYRTAQNAITALREALAAPQPEPSDMVMVPREPTPEMLAAILEPIKWAGGVHAYRAMIAAAPPAAPAPVVPEGDVVVSWNEDGQIVAVTRQDREGRILSVIAESAAPVVREPLTDEQIEQAVTVAVKSGACPWMGYKKDENGEYTLPVLSGVHYGIARAIEQAHGIGGGK